MVFHDFSLSLVITRAFSKAPSMFVIVMAKCNLGCVSAGFGIWSVTSAKASVQILSGAESQP